MTGGIPSTKTYERIMTIIDYKELEKIVLSFFKTITRDTYREIEILNFDGCVNNGSKRKKTYKSNEISPHNMLNVYSNKHQLCISSEIIDSKTNEIPTVGKLLDALNIEGSIYVVPIKKNHEIFYDELVSFFIVNMHVLHLSLLLYHPSVKD